ncbi:ATP-binding protein [Paenibacillus sedimenti]|uniref:AAA family ATPase n=1 Tax=Paenibacillus sedimenti TaxID=2770274 RepID=A0A926KSB3_9BACL|nr:ATP-binding protein [Paenibacillus sedimenti]MBD0382627.1 AAA family ATPase [Paenibacillus sedimenti]
MGKKKLPYGISDFKSLREQNYLYIDKTPYIEKMESFSGKYLFFIRPRRFGKSLFLSTLEHYYGLEHTDHFDKLFADLYIGKHPTSLRNSYCILKLNFSGLNTDNRNKLEESFRTAFRDALTSFLNTYNFIIEDAAAFKEQLGNKEDFRSLWSLLFEAVKSCGKKLFLIIDEYDHFANDIIAMGDAPLYKDIVRAAGFVRDFYESVKIGTEQVIDRIWMTGVSPIMLDDLTSGFNIATNLTMNASFNEMLGFTEQEVNAVIDAAGIQEQQTSLAELRQNYNGYLFSEDGTTRVYNPDMILYFFTQWELEGKYPKQLIDENVKTDNGRLQRLISSESNRKTLDEIIQNEEIAADIVSKFSFDLMYDEQYFVSLLFYMGLLTIDRKDRMRLVLKVPNFVIRTVLWEYLERRVRLEQNIRPNTDQLRKTIEQMAFDGTIKPFVDYIGEHVMKPLSNRDLNRFDEKYLKVLMFAYLIESRAYRPYSERETENGYMDIYLEKDTRVPGIVYDWIIELKYLKKQNVSDIEKVKVEGLKQLAGYAISRDLVDKSHVRRALIIFIGKDEWVVVEE